MILSASSSVTFTATTILAPQRSLLCVRRYAPLFASSTSPDVPCLQMNPPPTEPLYLIGIRAILCYLREFNEIEDLGFDKEDGAGVVTILSDAINWRESQSYSAKGSAPWLNYDL